MQRPQWMKNGKKSRADRRLFWKHKETKKKFTLLHWWTYVTSQMRSWSQNYSSTKAEPCSCETLQKTTLEPLQFFAEQGSFASQIIVAKLTDVIARLPGCDGQTVDAESGLYSGKIGGCSKNGSKFINRIVQMFGYVLHDKNGQNVWQTWKIPWHLTKFVWSSISWCAVGDNSKKLQMNLDGRKYRIGNACSFIGNKCYSCQHMWMTSKLLERCRIWVQCGKDDEHVDIHEPTTCLDHVYLRCTQREWKPNETIIEQYTKMFESRIFGGPMIWKDMLKNALSNIVNWQTRKWSNCSKFQVLPWIIINSSRKNSNLLQNCQNCLY